MPNDRRLLIPRFDLGARTLVPEWRALFSREGLREDAILGLSLAGALLPFSIWLAVLSGAPPEAGILTAAIGSAICVLIGGTKVAASGPGIATALVIGHVVRDHGFLALGAVVVFCGVLQIASGAIGLGRYIRLVPVAVIRGAVIGVGALALLLHLPSVIGAELTLDSPLERLDHLGAQIPNASIAALAIAVGSAVLGVGLPFIDKRIPGALIAIVIASIVVWIANLDVPMVARSVRPTVHAPSLVADQIAQLAFAALALFFTATLGTLASTMALEKSSNEPTDPDQELIGVGLSSVVLGLIGGLPAVHSIARSSIALRLGIARRRPALIQAFVVVAIGAAGWWIVDRVPIASLTGIALFAAVGLFDPRPLKDVFRIARFDLVVCVVTALGVAFFGIAEGLESGLGLAVVAATFRLARTRAIVHKSSTPDSPHQVSFSGPITFLASLELMRLRRELDAIDPSAGLVIDLRSVVALDGTGAEALAQVAQRWRERSGKLVFLGPSAIVRERLVAADPEIEPSIAKGARDVETILQNSGAMLGRPHLLAGIERFREEMREHYDSLFDQLADGQHPHTMFITCADSRISPALLLGSHPGDVFIVRCIGALVPPPESEHMPQEGAALEYGIGVLGVRHVVVCGHSKCGAISALKKGELPPALATLGKWSAHAAKVAGELGEFEDADSAARAVTVRQLEHIKRYPLVKERIENGGLRVHAWFYDLGAVELFEWDEEKAEYRVVGGEEAAR
jgi:carbonic anhydrase